MALWLTLRKRNNAELRESLPRTNSGITIEWIILLEIQSASALLLIRALYRNERLWGLKNIVLSDPTEDPIVWCAFGGIVLYMILIPIVVAVSAKATKRTGRAGFALKLPPWWLYVLPLASALICDVVAPDA